MPLMANLYVGASGMQTSQNALNTTAHNMANIGTTGYTRQQVSQGTMTYQTISQTQAANSWTQIGLGVTYNNCKQVRSVFLDSSYRTENGRNSFYSSTYAAINEIEDQLQEMDGAEFATTMDNLWVSVQELANDPTSAVNQSAFITRCNEFVERAQAVYSGLQSYQTNMNESVVTMVNNINSWGDSIRELNEKIVQIEAGGVEHANDLRDSRNLLLDQLSEMGNISYEEDIFGNVLVYFEGESFVTTDHVNYMGLDSEESSAGFYTPYWIGGAKKYTDENGEEKLDISGAHVFDLARPISTEANTDVGKLRAVLLARGDHYATYHDIQDNTDYYNTNIANSTIMNTQAEFDQLCNNIFLAINDVLGNMKSNPATVSGQGDVSDYWMFQQVDPEDALKYTIDSDHQAGYNQTGFTIMNTQVNNLLLQTPTANSFITREGEADNDAVEALKDAFTTSKYTLNPTTATTTTLRGYYNALVSQVSNDGFVYNTVSENQERTLSTIADAREQIVGTSSDEELEYMIQFQNAFNASSRYINVVNELLAHIINTLGT